MRASQVVELEGIGQVLFVRSERAKRLNITVRPSIGIRAAVPRRMSMDEARRLVLSHRHWIKKQQKKIETLAQKHDLLLDLVGDINRDYARRRLTDRLIFWAERHGFAFNRVFIRNQSTLWGSCSARNNINLNVKLVLLPVELMDYVLLHELLHTRIKSHGRSFWTELDKLVGDARALHRKLREYGLTLL